MAARRTSSLIGSGRGRGRPALPGLALALLALLSINLSPYFCHAFLPPAATAPAPEASAPEASAPEASAPEAPAPEASDGGTSLAELVALFGPGLAFCGPAPGAAGGEGTAPPELFCLACQLAAAGAPLLPEPPALPAASPAAAAPAFAPPADQLARAPWAPRDGPTRAPPKIL